jgi:hypothetical protein
MYAARMSRWVLLMVFLALPSLACNLSNPAPTPPPTPQTPSIGLQPVSGPPNTVITIAVAGFPAGAKVNLLATVDGSTTANLLARDLTISPAGTLTFAISLPAQIGTVALNRTTSLALTVQTADNLIRASAVFVATVGTTGNPGQPLPTATRTVVTGGGAVNNLFITGPPINSVHGGTRITVTGSGAAYDNAVYVQLTNANLNILASGTARINAAVGAVGAWRVDIDFFQPPARTAGFVVAYTLNRNAQIAQQASIPVVLTGPGAGLPTPTFTPTTIPIIVTNTPWIITATPIQ